MFFSGCGDKPSNIKYRVQGLLDQPSANHHNHHPYTIIIIKIKIINAHCSLLKMFNLFKKFVAKKNFARSLRVKLANPVKSVTKLQQIPLSTTYASKKETILSRVFLNYCLSQFPGRCLPVSSKSSINQRVSNIAVKLKILPLMLKNTSSQDHLSFH